MKVGQCSRLSGAFRRSNSNNVLTMKLSSAFLATDMVADLWILHQRVSHARRIRQGEVEEMALAAIDRRAYARLLTRILPQIITTDYENERMIAELEKFDNAAAPSPRKRSPWRC